MRTNIQIAIDSSEELIDFLNEFNKPHKTDFKLVSITYLDGVEFALIEYEKATSEDVFLLGFNFAGFRIRKGYI